MISLLLNSVDHNMLFIKLITTAAVAYICHAYDLVMERFRDKEVGRVSRRYNVDHSPHQCLQDCLSFQLILLLLLIFYCGRAKEK